VSALLAIRHVSSVVPARAWVFAGVATAGVVALAASGFRHAAVPGEVMVAVAPAIGAPGGPASSRDGLHGRVVEMENRLRQNPGDVAASISLADALLRQARAGNDSRPAGRAAVVLENALKEAPGSYDALRLLGAVDLSLHRFRDAFDVGRRARDMRPGDAWNYGVMGDALLELGDYDQAFENFDRMMQLRPGPGAYARVAYARELTGELAGAASAMEMAYTASSSRDPEAQAWYSTQLGELELKRGRTAEASRQFRRALFTFPEYPLAVVGAGKVKLAEGDAAGALALYLDQFGRTPTLDLAWRIGDLHAAAGRADQAEHYYQLAEDVAGPPAAQTEAALALFLADHDRKLDLAIDIAQRVAATRHDIATEHALAWAYYKAGRRSEAASTMTRALRTGWRDPDLLAHAAVVDAASKSALRR